MTFLITLLIMLAAFALVWWGVQQLTLPQPAKIIALVVIGLLALGWLYRSAGSLTLP